MSPPEAIPLTPTLVSTITAYISHGSYPRVAAELAGVPGTLFATWLQRGTEPDAPEEYRELLRAVRHAQAVARGTVETKLFREKPLDWLKHGPGKPGDLGDGWTQPARAGPVGGDLAEVDLLALPQFRQVLAVVMEVLAAYPEAQAAVLAALTVLSPPASSPGA